MATTLYLIRHGATVGNEEKRYKGSIDVPMSDDGVGQIKRSTEFIQTTLRASSVRRLCVSAFESTEERRIIGRAIRTDACDNSGSQGTPFRQMGGHDIQ